MAGTIGTKFIRLDTRGDFARIIPLGDVHIGHRASMLDKFQGYVDYIKNSKDTWAILMGDLVENVLPETAARHPGSMYEQCMTPEEQRGTITEILKPIAPKILFALEGNHSIRSWFQAQFSPEKEIAKALGVKWMGLDALVNIQVGKNRYAFHATHGTGSAISAMAIAQKMQQQAKVFFGADVYLRAHHHQKFVASDCLFDARKGVARKVYYVCIGSFLDYVGTYMHRKGGRPSALGTVKIKLYKGEWDVHVTA